MYKIYLLFHKTVRLLNYGFTHFFFSFHVKSISPQLFPFAVVEHVKTYWILVCTCLLARCKSARKLWDPQIELYYFELEQVWCKGKTKREISEVLRKIGSFTLLGECQWRRWYGSVFWLRTTLFVPRVLELRNYMVFPGFRSRMVVVRIEKLETKFGEWNEVLLQ